MSSTDARDPQAPGSARVLAGGILMGLANLVPGLSGGTMILAVGLYDRFIGAVADLTSLRLRRDSLVFLGLVAVGAALAIVSCSGVAVSLVTERRWVAYSLFIGMTLGGTPELVRECRPAGPAGIAGFSAGLGLIAGLAWCVSGASFTVSTPLLVGVGALAASSMILPGISGAYLLLIFGVYEVVIGSISVQSLVEDTAASLEVIAPVALGAVAGIALVSNLLQRLLARHPRPSYAVLLGLLVGSVLGLWPFQEPRHPDLAHDGRRAAVEFVLAGASPQALEVEGVSVRTAEGWRSAYGTMSLAERERAARSKVRFGPSAGQLLGALALVAAGVALTRALGARGGGRAGPRGR
jgi:putative membrane protein